MTTKLFVGNKNYSSWSLRPWLVLRWAELPFEEVRIDLRRPGYGKGRIGAVLAVSPTGFVPALHREKEGEPSLRLHDSLAISEWAAEQVPTGTLWPEDPDTRALARAVTCEMHSGFAGVRRDLPMNLHRRCEQPSWPDETQRGIERITQLFSELRQQFSTTGPWLFGTRSIADAFYAPVVTRFRTYSVPLPDLAQRYCDTVLQDAAYLEWHDAALVELEEQGGFGRIDGLYA